jgi:hypothetical protein
MLDALTWRLNAPLLMVDALRASHARFNLSEIFILKSHLQLK